MKAILVLEDGRTFEGISFGAEGETSGEVVFNTSLTGYQEVLTDPSYHGQIVTMTSPLIGNYGINPFDEESKEIQVSGFVIKEPSRITSNFRSSMSLGDYLKKKGIVAIAGVDTRAITRHIRSAGAMRGVISTTSLDRDELARKAKGVLPMSGRDLVKNVTCETKYEFTEGLWRLGDTFGSGGESIYHVAALDLGMKRNILRNLCEQGCRVTVFPASATPEEIMSVKPDGLFLSNGPGDPDAVGYVKETIKSLVAKLPVFGICLGHQLLCLALGAKTFKLKFGHRGINHPVMDVPAGRIVRITSQNHGFAVDPDSLPDELEMTHYSLYDRTVEGVRHRTLPVFSVQYHPEASPGPHDTMVHFRQFVDLMGKGGAAL